MSRISRAGSARKGFGVSVEDRFLRFYIGNKIMFMNTSERNRVSGWPEISRNIQIKYLFHFKAYFYVLNTFHTSCTNAFKSESLILKTN